MSKHFKMYIAITDIVGEKGIDLTYPIQGKEAAVVSVFSDNIQHEFTEPWLIELESGNKRVTARTYTRQESIELTQLTKILR